ncbi:hypothetical protein GF373_01500 [bacterium]|nr:hypothetical protein [bacterium]
MKKIAILAALAIFFVFTVNLHAKELARFEIREPLGQTWEDEWLDREISINLEGKSIPVAKLDLRANGKSIPAQFHILLNGKTLLALNDGDMLETVGSLAVLFKATIPKNETVTFTVTDERKESREWQPLAIEETPDRIVVKNGIYEMVFDSRNPLPVNAIRCQGMELGEFSWPEGINVSGVRDTWIDKGPAVAALHRKFFIKPDNYYYQIIYTFYQNDPWVYVQDAYRLGMGSALQIDLRGLGADAVYHPYAYNARTFSPGGDKEDSTLQPPQHPIATLGPIWRDIWYNGGPFAFVYRENAPAGIGFAAIKGSLWKTLNEITPESQNLFIHGDKKEEGQVRVEVPTDGGTRHWAWVIGPPAVRHAMSRLVRSHADIPLNKVLHEWVLDWEADAKPVSNGLAKTYLSAHYNRHLLNPTTLPRRVYRSLPDEGPVKSKDLAVLAYVFTDPNYWPGPSYEWEIGNPNFHTDMYSIPLHIGLVMPSHPHAADWVKYGIRETQGDLERNSYPGGAWQESLSYSKYYFHMAENAAKIKRSGLLNPFAEWPRLKEVATYLAAMHTPVDPRYGERQIAPIGDTSPDNYAKKLHAIGEEYKGVDDRFAEQLMRFPEPWEHALDIGSRAFPGFGAMLRGNAYDQRHESLVTIKAGPARNHYQRDELAFHFCGLGTPLLIDHACHYSPRPWSAAMHNRPDMNDKSPVTLAKPIAYQSNKHADVFVAEEETDQIRHTPLRPHYTVKPGWEYKTETLANDTWRMRRYTMLVKHDPKRSEIPDYLVIRDEIDSPEPIWWNLHALARDIQEDGQSILFPGQLDVDLTAHFITPQIEQVQKREWGWKAFKSGNRRTLKRDDYEEMYFGSYIPKDFQLGTWGTDKELSGEMTKWCRVKGDAGQTEWFVVLMPHKKGTQAPRVKQLSKTSAEIRLGGEREIVHLGTEALYPAAIIVNNKETVLIEGDDFELP